MSNWHTYNTGNSRLLKCLVLLHPYVIKSTPPILPHHQRNLIQRWPTRDLKYACKPQQVDQTVPICALVIGTRMIKVQQLQLRDL